MSSLCFGISVTPDMKYVHKPAVNTHCVCMSDGVYEFCPLHDINPWLLRPCTPPYPTPPAPAPMVPSPSMMRPIWRCTTSASPLCPSWLTASWSSTSAWRFFWTMLPSTGKSGYLSVPFACLRTLPSFSVIYVIWLMFFFILPFYDHLQKNCKECHVTVETLPLLDCTWSLPRLALFLWCSKFVL